MGVFGFGHSGMIFTFTISGAPIEMLLG